MSNPFDNACFPRDPAWSATGPLTYGGQRFGSLHDLYQAPSYGLPTVPAWQRPTSFMTQSGPVQVRYNAFGQPQANGAFNAYGTQID